MDLSGPYFKQCWGPMLGPTATLLLLRRVPTLWPSTSQLGSTRLEGRRSVAMGRAGGKTTTVAACADAWNAAGDRVLGTAVKGEAARTLAAATGIECETVAWYLAHDDPQDLPPGARRSS